MKENFDIDYIPEPIAEPEILQDMPMTWEEEQRYKEKKKAKRLLITLSLLLVASLLLSTFSIIKAYSIPLIQGEQGIQGEKGEQGIQGIAGLNGLDGKDGKDGLDGKDGEKGEQGIQGMQGEKGLDGKDGKDGLTPYIKDGYWWIGNENTGYKIDNCQCIETPITPTKTRTIGYTSDYKTVLNDFCLNHNVTTIIVKHGLSYSGFGPTNDYWILPYISGVGTRFRFSNSNEDYSKLFVADADTVTASNVIIEGDYVNIIYTIEEFFLMENIGMGIKTFELNYFE